MSDPNCVICGGKKAEAVSWRAYCELCATQTWGASTVAGFIQQLIVCSEQLADAEAKIRMMNQRGLH